jgi:hypothetical protein
MLNFSASTHAKHVPGIQVKGACKKHLWDETEDCIKDKGIMNQHGVWFIPDRFSNSTPPAIFQDLKFVPHMKMAIKPDGKPYFN